MDIDTLVFVALVCLIILVISLIYLTDPFNRYTIIKLPYQFRLTKLAHTIIDNNHVVKVHQGKLYRMFAIAKAGWHILHTRYISSPRSSATTVEAVIADIHKRRFDPAKLLVISGDHFNGLFVRNLGVFYYPLLDSAGPLGADVEDWSNRQRAYLQTVAYALGIYSKHTVPSTTIIPTGPLDATCVNFYAYPSDTVYGIVFALAVLAGKQPANPYRPARAQRLPLRTKPAAALLINTYRQTLIDLYGQYRNFVFDDQTGLIKTSVHLSGAKDITRRRSSFYDNVIFWKTTQLLQQLGLIKKDRLFLDQLKDRIIQTFWLEREGYFLEDLSEESRTGRYYSSDWLAVLFTGFLDVQDPHERHYFERSVRYIRANGIDRPFAIKYQHETRGARQFLPVRLAVASYGGDAIWSFWGMEYIKTLSLLYKSTGKQKYLREAARQIKQYKHNILVYGGFPEVYDARGDMLQTPLYRSIRQTGWVVGFEQACGLFEYCRRTGRR